MNTPTPTPRTDAKQKLKDIIGDEYVVVDFARQLERELTAARGELKAVTIERDEFHVKIEELAIKLQAVTERQSAHTEGASAPLRKH